MAKPTHEQITDLFDDDKAFLAFHTTLGRPYSDILDCARSIHQFQRMASPDQNGLAFDQASFILDTYLRLGSSRSLLGQLAQEVTDPRERWQVPTAAIGGSSSDITVPRDLFNEIQQKLLALVAPKFEEFVLSGTSNTQGIGIRNVIAYFLCGLINNFGYVIMLSAAQDILNKELPAALVLLADILPSLAIKATAPLYLHLIPFWIRIAFSVGSAIGGFHLVGWGEAVWVKLLGVILASISSGYGEVTFLALTSFYHKNAVSAWSSGTGAAGIAGSIFYLALTKWAGQSSFVTVMICSAFPVIMALAYFVIMTPGLIPLTTKKAVTKTINTDPEDAQKESYPLLNDSAPPSVVISSEPEFQSLAFWRKLVSIRSQLFRYMLPLTTVYFAEYYINQGVVPVLKFPDNPMFAGSEYVYYAAIYQVGVFLSRSSVNLVQVRILWIFPILQYANLAILFTDAIFRYIPTIWVIFGIILFEGFLGGGCYVNVYYLLSEEKSGREKEFAITVVSMSDAIGISLAGVAGFFTEPWLLTFNTAPTPPAAPSEPGVPLPPTNTTAPIASPEASPVASPVAPS